MSQRILTLDLTEKGQGETDHGIADAISAGIDTVSSGRHVFTFHRSIHVDAYDSTIKLMGTLAVEGLSNGVVPAVEAYLINDGLATKQHGRYTTSSAGLFGDEED